MNFEPRVYPSGPPAVISHGTLDVDDETTAICPGCGKGFEPGSEFLEYRVRYRDEDDLVELFHYGCEA